MTAEKPRDIGKYRKWLRDCHGVGKISLGRARYDSVSSKMYMTFTGSSIWGTIINALAPTDQQYYLETEYPLLTTTPPEVLIKSFDSFLLKTFQKNILKNPHWPNEPEGGWYLPVNWYARINDIIRTRFVVKYLDGVEFLAEQLCSLLTDQGCQTCVDFEAKEEGYYAAHLYTRYECEIPREDWDTERTLAIVEMQVTTQVQDVISTLLHKYYEDRRKRVEDGERKWQWDYASDEFAANYLGHILHYVEGMMMDIRERQKEAAR